MGCCSASCKYFKYKDNYKFTEHKDENGKVYWREREYVGREFYCDKCNERYLQFLKDFEYEYRHKSSKWFEENVKMDCYEPTEYTKTLSDMHDALEGLLKSLNKG